MFSLKTDSRQSVGYGVKLIIGSSFDTGRDFVENVYGKITHWLSDDACSHELSCLVTLWY